MTEILGDLVSKIIQVHKPGVHMSEFTHDNLMGKSTCMKFMSLYASPLGFVLAKCNREIQSLEVLCIWYK